MKERILPRNLAERWARVPLPAWVAECCRLPRNSTVQSLATAALPPISDGASRAAIEFFVAELLRTRLGEIADLRAFPRGIVIDKEFLAKADCSTRAMNALRQAGLLKNPSLLSNVTYGELRKIRGLGVRSLLSLALCSEALTSLRVAEPNESQAYSTSAADLSAIRGVLQELADSDSAEIISGGDPRFSDLIPADVDSLAAFSRYVLAEIVTQRDAGTTQLALPIDLPDLPHESASLLQWLSEIKTRIKQIEMLTLEDLLSQYLRACTGFAGQRLDAMLARLGWAGSPPTTLEEAGQLLNVTRERIRQIEKKVRNRLPSTPVFAPTLSRAVTALLNAIPIETEKATSLLRERGFSKRKFSPESLLAAATDLGFDPPFAVSTAGALRMVTRATYPEHTRLILSIARKKSGASGVASSVDVAAKVTQMTDGMCSSEEVQKTLEASAKFSHLTGPWYWATDIPEGRNRLVNICRKMLSATSPISISRLREGVKREYMFRNLSSPGRFDLRVPPTEVMRTFLTAHPEFLVDEDMVRPAAPLDYRRELGEVDSVLVDVLRSNPSAVLDRTSIVSECMRRGLNPLSTNTVMAHSCIVEHVDTNIWALCGADINPAAIEALRKANALRPKEVRIRNYGWTADGRLWIAAFVPPATQAAQIGCPAASREYLAGQKFVASMPDGTPCGTLGVTKDGLIYGFTTFQRLSGWDPGDVIVVEFNLENRTAKLILGNEELLDVYEKD